MGKTCQHCGVKYESLLWGHLIDPAVGSGGGYCSAVCRVAAANRNSRNKAAEAIQRAVDIAEEKRKKELDAYNASIKLLRDIKISWSLDPTNRPCFHPIQLWHWSCGHCQKIVFNPFRLPNCSVCNKPSLQSGYQPYYGNPVEEFSQDLIDYKGFTINFECSYCDKNERLGSFNCLCPNCSIPLSQKGFSYFSGIRPCPAWITGWKIVEMEVINTLFNGKHIPRVSEIRSKYGMPDNAPIIGASILGNRMLFTGQTAYFLDKNKVARAESISAIVKAAKTFQKRGWMKTSLRIGSAEIVLPNHEVKLFTELAEHIEEATKPPFGVTELQASSAVSQSAKPVICTKPRFTKEPLDHRNVSKKSRQELNSIKRTKHTVGRGQAASIRIPDHESSVSRLHLEIEDLGSGWVALRDLGSANGTKILLENKWIRITNTTQAKSNVEIMLGDHHTSPQALLNMIR